MNLGPWAVLHKNYTSPNKKNKKWPNRLAPLFGSIQQPSNNIISFWECVFLYGFTPVHLFLGWFEGLFVYFFLSKNNLADFHETQWKDVTMGVQEEPS